MNLGNNLVTNGQFDGNLAGWTIVAGNWECIGVYAKATVDNGTATLRQVLPIRAGETYRIDYEIIDTSGGELGLTLGGTADALDETVGRHSTFVSAGSDNANLDFDFSSSGYDYIGIDNIEVRQVFQTSDGGLIGRLEAWLAAQLAALSLDGSTIFRTAEQWKYQIAAGSGGAEAFGRYAPFAFVSYYPAQPAREGDYDLCQVLRFAVLIGTDAKSDGAARLGDGEHLGVSRLRDLVIAELDGSHPGAGFECDDFYYTGETEAYEDPRRYAVEMYFNCNLLSD